MKLSNNLQKQSFIIIDATTLIWMIIYSDTKIGISITFLFKLKIFLPWKAMANLSKYTSYLPCDASNATFKYSSNELTILELPKLIGITKFVSIKRDTLPELKERM